MTLSEAKQLVEECGLNIEEPVHEEVMQIIREALDRRIPKKPEIEPFYGGRCTVCNAVIPNKIVKYCCICGQAIDRGEDS